MRFMEYGKVANAGMDEFVTRLVIKAMVPPETPGTTSAAPMASPRA